MACRLRREDVELRRLSLENLRTKIGQISEEIENLKVTICFHYRLNGIKSLRTISQALQRRKPKCSMRRSGWLSMIKKTPYPKCQKTNLMMLMKITIEA
jgi:hypothetical protein